MQRRASIFSIRRKKSYSMILGRKKKFTPLDEMGVGDDKLERVNRGHGWEDLSKILGVGHLHKPVGGGAGNDGCFLVYCGTLGSTILGALAS